MVVPAIQTNALALARRLIEKHGRSITLIQKPFDTTTQPRTFEGLQQASEAGTLTGGLQTDAIGAFAELSTAELLGERTQVEDSGLITKTRRHCLVAGIDNFDPRTVHTILDKGREFRVEDLHVFDPGELDIIYFFEVQQ